MPSTCDPGLAGWVRHYKAKGYGWQDVYVLLLAAGIVRMGEDDQILVREVYFGRGSTHERKD